MEDEAIVIKIQQNIEIIRAHAKQIAELCEMYKVKYERLHTMQFLEQQISNYYRTRERDNK